MPLNLEEAETAAYLDPSQENLAVYVKLLEEALDDAGHAASIIKVLEDHGLDPDDPEVLEEQLAEMERAASL